MFSVKEKELIVARGSDISTVVQQVENFEEGFPFLQLERAAAVGCTLRDLFIIGSTKFRIN